MTPVAGGQSTVLATATTTGAAVAVYSGYVYWIDTIGARSSVKRVPVAGGPDEVLVDLQLVFYPLGIAADAQGVYAMGWPGRLSQSLYRVPYAGGSFIPLWSRSLNNARTLGEFVLIESDTGSSIYNANGYSSSGRIERFDLGVSEASLTTTVSSYTSFQSHPQRMAVSGDNIYYTQSAYCPNAMGHCVRRISTNGGEATTLSGAGAPTSIAADQTSVYFNSLDAIVKVSAEDASSIP